MTILELREKRNTAWNAAKAFLDSHRTEKGTLTAEDDTTYSRMEQEIADLGKEILVWRGRKHWIAFTPAKTTYFFVLSILISFNGNDLNNFSTFFAKVSNSSICLSNISASASSLASSANSANTLLAALIALST